MGVLCISMVAHASDRIADQRVIIQLMDHTDLISVEVTKEIHISDADHTIELEPGVYSFTPETVDPAKQRFHLFAKTFQLDEAEAEAAYLKSWADRGHTVLSITNGKKLQTAKGRILDARVHWISIVQTTTEAEALAQQQLLNTAEQWTWMRQEVTNPGSGTVHIRGTTGAQTLRLPITLSASDPIVVSDVDVGFWDTNKQQLSYSGELEISITAEGKLELLEHIGVEEYLQGVLPSEMPWSWPLEALKAQAVAARSEVLSNLSTKHTLEGFDFCATEHCRAYRGRTMRKLETDQALLQTQGEILVHEEGIAPALFSANCGGWTEDNDTVWFGPPHKVLRARPDLLNPMAPPFQRAGKLRLWLSQPPEAYCEGDTTGFRWTRIFSESELLNQLNKKYTISDIQRIELGDRGAGGRLKWIWIHHAGKSVYIKKELPIRQALGGLPSALFDLTVSGTAPDRTFSLHGGGRGHGVGLCQHGANGMAKLGHSHQEILYHYFNDVSIERVQ